MSLEVNIRHVSQVNACKRELCLGMRFDHQGNLSESIMSLEVNIRRVYQVHACK